MAVERLSMRTFRVGTVDPLFSSGRFYPKGGGNLPPPFGSLLVTTTHILDITGWIRRIRQYSNDISNHKPLLIVVKRLADALASKKHDFRFHLAPLMGFSSKPIFRCGLTCGAISSRLAPK